MKTLIATMVSAAAIAAASASEFDANAFLGRVEKVSRSTSQKELESLVKVAEENGKAVAEAVARRLTDKSVKEDDKETFRKLLKSEAKGSAAAKFMKETVESKADVPEDMRAKFKADADKFNAAYKTILDSGVHFSWDCEASQDIVYCATQSDIPKLKELRRRALYRQSDECFYDYRALTRVIQMVRACASK